MVWNSFNLIGTTTYKQYKVFKICPFHDSVISDDITDCATVEGVSPWRVTILSSGIKGEPLGEIPEIPTSWKSKEIVVES